MSVNDFHFGRHNVRCPRWPDKTQTVNLLFGNSLVNPVNLNSDQLLISPYNTIT